MEAWRIEGVEEWRIGEDKESSSQGGLEWRSGGVEEWGSRELEE